MAKKIEWTDKMINDLKDFMESPYSSYKDASEHLGIEYRTVVRKANELDFKNASLKELGLKECSCCARIYPATTDFFMVGGAKDGLQSRCKKCFNDTYHGNDTPKRRRMTSEEKKYIIYSYSKPEVTLEEISETVKCSIDQIRSIIKYERSKGVEIPERKPLFRRRKGVE